MVTSDELESAVSEAVSRSTYDPDMENAAVVFLELTLPNVTVPGPLTLDQVVVIVLPVGKPSSVAVPVRVTEAGNVMV